MNLRLSLTFKMTYFACCYPITNESGCVCVCVCMLDSVAGMNWGPCYTTDEEFVCVSKSSGID